MQRPITMTDDIPKASYMVKVIVGVPKSKDQLRCAEITSDADDRAINDAQPLDLDPVSTTARNVRAVCAFRDDALNAR
jgi:hypothetical protein